jgi:hypothetical protein
MLRRGIGRAGRPGVIGTVARTAVVAGTATAVSGRVQRRQQARYQDAADEQMQAEMAMAPPPPPPPAPAVAGTAEQLQQLADLHAQGALTDEEFAAGKARILQG